MRRSTVLSLPLQLEFPVTSIISQLQPVKFIINKGGGEFGNPLANCLQEINSSTFFSNRSPCERKVSVKS